MFASESHEFTLMSQCRRRLHPGTNKHNKTKIYQHAMNCSAEWLAQPARNHAKWVLHVAWWWHDREHYSQAVMPQSGWHLAWQAVSFFHHWEGMPPIMNWDCLPSSVSIWLWHESLTFMLPVMPPSWHMQNPLGMISCQIMPILPSNWQPGAIWTILCARPVLRRPPRSTDIMCRFYQ